ncbi:MAG: two-component system chemotaxis response regulator CheB [Cellvibrionaceae bacterium]|jgi:two-component system chemotaxis response regulator CheB
MTINVLIVDDSAVVRTVLSKILNGATGIKVIATAQDPIFALQRLESIKPDVIILDVEMPRMDGISFLKKIMQENPIATVMCSTLTEKSSATSIKALSLGAIEVIAKPKTDLQNTLGESAQQIVAAVRNAAHAKLIPLRKKSSNMISIAPKLTADAILSKQRAHNTVAADDIVAIGTSTGGTRALEDILPHLSPSCSGVVVVQHMPPVFTNAFANRLNSLCGVEVKEAQHGDLIHRGTVYIAPGGRHMLVDVNKAGQAYITLKDGPLVSRHRPSVDVLFRSVAKSFGKKALGIIMTGMGDDGAKGLKEMKDAGAETLAQDEASCVVYGMPAVAVEINAVLKQLPLDDIPKAIERFSTMGHSIKKPAG